MYVWCIGGPYCILCVCMCGVDHIRQPSVSVRKGSIHRSFHFVGGRNCWVCFWVERCAYLCSSKWRTSVWGISNGCVHGPCTGPSSCGISRALSSVIRDGPYILKGGRKNTGAECSKNLPTRRGKSGIVFIKTHTGNMLCAITHNTHTHNQERGANTDLDDAYTKCRCGLTSLTKILKNTKGWRKI